MAVIYQFSVSTDIKKDNAAIYEKFPDEEMIRWFKRYVKSEMTTGEEIDNAVDTYNMGTGSFRSFIDRVAASSRAKYHAKSMAQTISSGQHVSMPM